MKQRITFLLNWLAVVSMLLAALAPLPVLAAPPAQAPACAQEYTVQADDWVSKIADKLLGNVLAYPAIVEATNQQHAADATFAEISNPDVIQVGWKLCIPRAEDAETLLAAAPAAPAAAVAPL